MKRTTRRGRREGAMFVAQWKKYGFESVEACLYHQEQDYAREMRTVERHKALPKRRWQRALLREQEGYLDGLIVGARMMAARLKSEEQCRDVSHAQPGSEDVTRQQCHNGRLKAANATKTRHDGA